MPRNDREPKWRFVRTKHLKNVYNYGFLSVTEANMLKEFGQADIGDKVNLKRLIIGANSFKPLRAQKFVSDKVGWISTFCSDAVRKNLKKAGYRITRKRLKIYTPSSVSKIYIAKYNDVDFAWVRGEVPSGVNIGDIGVTVATQNDEPIFGCSFPKPAKVAKTLSTGGIIQMWCGQSALNNDGTLKSAAVTKGWSLVEEGRFLRNHLNIFRGFN